MANSHTDSNRSLRHTDDYANDFGHDERDDVDITYNGSTDEANDDQDPDPVEYSHPIDDPTDLSHTAHLDAQLRHALPPVTPPAVTDADTNAFDAAVLRVAPAPSTPTARPSKPCRLPPRERKRCSCTRPGT